VNALPLGWDSRSLSDVCLRPKKSDPVALGRSTIRYIDIGSVDGSRHSVTDVPTLEAASAPTRARQIVRTGDTVFSTVRPYLEKIAYVGVGLDDEFASTGFCVLRPGPRLDARWLFHFSTSRLLLDQVLPHQRGVSYPAVRDKEVLAAEIPLPNIVTQRRIVEILEDHLSRVDAGASSLDVASRRLRFLVASATEAVRNEAAELGPEASLGSLGVASGYGTSAKCVANGPGPAVVRIPNLVGGTIDLSDEKRVEDGSLDVSGLMLDPGDLLFVRTNGSRDLIGRTGVVQDGVRAAFASYLIRYKLDVARLRPQWVHLMMRTPGSRRLLESMAASSAGQYNLSLSKLDRVAVPVPTLDEQDRLLIRSRGIEGAAGRLHGDLTSATARRIALRRSLLTAAFAARLTGQTEDDEVVEELASV